MPSRLGGTELKDFIDENVNLLVVIGVFAGLSVYFSGLNLPFFLNFLSIAPLGMLILLLLELVKNSMSVRNPSINLMLFQLLLSIFLAGVIIYYVLKGLGYC